MKKVKWVFIFIFFYLNMSAGLGAADIEITAGINADKIGIDDVLVYTVTFKGTNNPNQPRLSGLKDFKVGQTSHTTEFRFVNGVSSYYTNFIYYLIPLKTGTLRIPPVKYEFQGRSYSTQSYIVQVVKGSVSPRQSQPRRRRIPSIFDDADNFSRSPFRRTQPREVDVKLRAVVSKKNAVKGEPILYRVLLYARNRIQSVNMVSNQSFPGFWQEWFPVPQSIDNTQGELDGKVYKVYEIRKAVLFPTQAGDVVIPSLKFDLTLLERSFSLFAEPRKISRATPEITVRASEPPPQGRGLPVGDFSFSVRPDKKEVDINDILTLRLKIRSRKGNIKTLEIPQFITTGYYKLYPSKISRDTAFNGNSLTGIVEAEMPVSFKKTGLMSFPTLEFKYFNPDAKIVVTLKSSPFSINVVGFKEKQESAVSMPQSEIIKKGEDVDFIKKGDIYNQENYFYKTGFFNILLAAFFLFNLLFLLKLVVFDRFIARSSLLKKKMLLNKTLSQLRQVREYGAISPILEEYLKEKTGLGLSEINNHSIGALLSKHRVNDSDIKVFIKLKSDSELSRFAPPAGGGGGTSAKENKKTLLHDLGQLIEILKRIDGRIK
ncbi:MAG: protein BatD [bacterium]|nr:protein BatD [bacterium]